MGNKQTNNLGNNQENMEIYAPNAVADLRSMSSNTIGLHYFINKLVQITSKLRNRLPLIRAGMIEVLVEKLKDDDSMEMTRQPIFRCLLNLSLCDEGKQIIIEKGLEKTIEDHSGHSWYLATETNAENSMCVSRILDGCHRYKYKLNHPTQIPIKG